MPDLINKKLEYINQLFIEGLYYKSLDAIEDFEQKEDLSTDDRISCNLLKSKLYLYLGKYTDALKFAEQACSMCPELGINSFSVDSYISKAWALSALRDYDLVLQLISKGEEALKELTIKPQSEFAKRRSFEINQK